MKNIYILVLFCFALIIVVALLSGCGTSSSGGGSSVSLGWQKNFGGSAQDFAFSVKKVSSEGYVIAGYTNSTDEDITSKHLLEDCWIVRVGLSGNIIWQKCFGGDSLERATNIINTPDGGFAFVGNSQSNDGDVGNNYGGKDYWVVKLTSMGTMEWEKNLGGSGEDLGWDICYAVTGGYIAVGYSNSSDNNVGGNNGGNDVWAVKLTNFGTIEWEENFGGSGDDYCRSVFPTLDGGCVIGGHSQSNDGDLAVNNGGSDAWILKLSSSGSKEWSKTYGGSQADSIHDVEQLSDGSYICSGGSSSTNEDFSGNHGTTDLLVLKLTSTGSLEWQKCFGGSANEEGLVIDQVTGGYLVGGYTDSNDEQVSGNHGLNDFWVIKITSTGSLEWQKCHGGTSNDYAYGMTESIDFGYILTGNTYSDDGDVGDNYGSGDIWVIKRRY